MTGLRKRYTEMACGHTETMRKARKSGHTGPRALKLLSHSFS